MTIIPIESRRGWVGQGPEKGKIGNEIIDRLNVEINAGYADQSKLQPLRRRGGQVEPRTGGRRVGESPVIRVPPNNSS
jgi:hypothetical protein